LRIEVPLGNAILDLQSSIFKGTLCPKDSGLPNIGPAKLRIPWEAIGLAKRWRASSMAKTVVFHEVDAWRGITSAAGSRCSSLPTQTCNYLQKPLLRSCADFGRAVSLLLLMGHTYQAIDFAPKLATMLGRGFIPNCVDYQWDGRKLAFVRQVFNGKLNCRWGWGSRSWFRSRGHSTPMIKRSRIRSWFDWMCLAARGSQAQGAGSDSGPGQGG
jgi:hypothetical protein